MNDDLFIYKNFVLQGKIQNYISLSWTRRFNDVGEFSLVMYTEPKNIELIKSGDVIYKGNDGEAVFIEDIISDDNAGTFTVSGRFLNSIFDRRIITYKKNTDIKTAITDIINQNFIAATNVNRNISNLKIISTAIKNNVAINADFENQSALETIKKICGDNNIGFKILYNIKNMAYDFYLYEGKETLAEFSENYRNIETQDYYYQTKDFKNVCIIPYSNSLQIYNDNIKGLERREIFTSTTSGATSETIKEQAKLFLSDKVIINTFDTVINSKSPQFIYKKDFDLGDIVSNRSEIWQLSIQKNILEITEYYDSAGENLAIVFGDKLPK